MKRDDVYKLIDGERNYQENASKPSFRKKTVAEELVLIERYARKAGDLWADIIGDEDCLNEIRKIAAICVRCMEHHNTLSR